MLRYAYALFTVLIFADQLNAQTPTIEHLKKQVETAQDPAIKLQALFSLCEQRQSLSADTLCKYASAAKQISMAHNNVRDIAIADYNIAGCLIKKGFLDSALKICEGHLSKIKNDKANAAVLMKLTTIKAQVLIRTHKYKEGLAVLYKLLHSAEQYQDTMMQVVAKNGLGWINMEMDQTSEALKWFFLALKTSHDPTYHENNSNIYSNIAAVYKQMNKNDSAEYFIKSAIIFSRKTENVFYLANSLNILADIYINTKRQELAKAPLEEALQIRKRIGDPFYIVSDISQLAIYYASILQPAKGIEVSMQGIEMAEKFGLYSKLPFLYHGLGENYKAAGNYLQYSKTLEKIIALKDSIDLANSAEARAEMDARYDLAKKESLINLQKVDILRKNNLFYATLIVLVFVSVLTWLLLRGYKKNQQIKLLKMQAEEKQMAARAVLTAEEKERKRISRDLHDNLGAYATVLMANTEQLKKQTIGQEIKRSAENVSDNAQNIMGSLQETIWVLNNDVITVTDFIDRFKMYSKKMLQHFATIQIRFKEELITDQKLSPAEALHLFRIMQEALQNTIKHGKAENIIVSVISDNSVYISIKDDGGGFNENTMNEGNGLLNMHHRAKEAGYKLNIMSADGGTEITLQKSNAFAGFH